MRVTFCMDIPGVTIPTTETLIVCENFPRVPQKGDTVSIPKGRHPGERTRGIPWWEVTEVCYSIDTPDQVSVGVRPPYVEE